MRRINKTCIVAMFAMTVLSFTNLFGVSIAGIVIFIGIAFFFLNKRIEEQPFEGSGLDIKAIGTSLKKKPIWLWIFAPLVMDAFSIALSKLVLPEYIDHVIARAGAFISYDKAALLVVQLAVLALGEEIAWRAFFQKQLQKVLTIAPVLIISSILFALGHIARGSFTVVAYDVFFVFVNSILYGIVFHKTNNAWVSAISHFIANLFSIIVFALL